MTLGVYLFFLHPCVSEQAGEYSSNPSAFADILPRGARVQSSRGMTFSHTRRAPRAPPCGLVPLHGAAHKKATKKQLLTAFGCFKFQYYLVLFTLYEIFSVL